MNTNADGGVLLSSYMHGVEDQLRKLTCKISRPRAKQHESGCVHADTLTLTGIGPGRSGTSAVAIMMSVAVVPNTSLPLSGTLPAYTSIVPVMHPIFAVPLCSSGSKLRCAAQASWLWQVASLAQRHTIGAAVVA